MALLRSGVELDVPVEVREDLGVKMEGEAEAVEDGFWDFDIVLALGSRESSDGYVRFAYLLTFWLVDG